MNKKMNFKIRLQNPQFIASVVMSILTPILGYMGITVQDITTWKALGDILMQAVANPYVLGLVVVSLYNTCVDFTTPGLKDSQRVLEKNDIND